jgi:hypothetical protein
MKKRLLTIKKVGIPPNSSLRRKRKATSSFESLLKRSLEAMVPYDMEPQDYFDRLEENRRGAMKR